MGGASIGSETQVPRLIRKGTSGALNWREWIDEQGRLCLQVQNRGIWLTRWRLDRAGNLEIAGVVTPGVVF